MIDTLGAITYPLLSAVAFVSFAVRIFFVWYIHWAEEPSTFSFWTVPEARKLSVLALTNLLMCIAFGLISWVIQHPDWSDTIRPIRIITWGTCVPIWFYSVVLKFQELRERQKKVK